MTSAARTAAAAAGLLAAGLGVAGAALAVPTDHAGPRATSERERGIVLACHGDGVRTTVYENSRHGGSVVVVAGDPDDNRFGSVERTRVFVVEGTLRQRVRLADGSVAVVRGRVATTGAPTPVRERFEDAGGLVVTTGTTLRLRADLVVSVDGHPVPVGCDQAFAFDQTVRRTRLYGG
jgi:hypothetical protein